MELSSQLIYVLSKEKWGGGGVTGWREEGWWFVKAGEQKQVVNHCF